MITWIGLQKCMMQRVHGGFGHGRSDIKGENTLRTSITFDLTIVVTFSRNAHHTVHLSGL